MQVLGAQRILHVYREQYQIANTLAKEGLRQDNTGHTYFLEVPPMSSDTRIQADIAGTIFVKKTYVKTTGITNLLPLGRGCGPT